MQVPNPSGSTTEKWQPSRWGVDPRTERLRQLLLSEGVEDGLALGFAMAMTEAMQYRTFDRRELLEEFSRWANTHTHTFTSTPEEPVVPPNWLYRWVASDLSTLNNDDPIPSSMAWGDERPVFTSFGTPIFKSDPFGTGVPGVYFDGSSQFFGDNTAVDVHDIGKYLLFQVCTIENISGDEYLSGFGEVGNYEPYTLIRDGSLYHSNTTTVYPNGPHNDSAPHCFIATGVDDGLTITDGLETSYTTTKTGFFSKGLEYETAIGHYNNSSGSFTGLLGEILVYEIGAESDPATQELISDLLVYSSNRYGTLNLS